MLTVEEIKNFLKEDEASFLKMQAAEGQRYYEGKHDILNYRMFYWNNDDELVEDTTRSNVPAPSCARSRWRTRSTVPRPRPSPPFWKLWKSIR